MLGVGTARDLQAEATQEAPGAGIVAGAWRPGDEGRGRRGLQTRGRSSARWSPQKYRGPARLSREAAPALTSKLVLRLSPSAIIPKVPPHQPCSEISTATPMRRHAQQTAYIGRPPFPTAPAKAVRHWAYRTQARGEWDQPLPSAGLEIEVKGERGRAGLRGRGQKRTNQRPGDVHGPSQAFRKRFNSCSSSLGRALVSPGLAARVSLGSSAESQSS